MVCRICDICSNLFISSYVVIPQYNQQIEILSSYSHIIRRETRNYFYKENFQSVLGIMTWEQRPRCLNKFKILSNHYRSSADCKAFAKSLADKQHLEETSLKRKCVTNGSDIQNSTKFCNVSECTDYVDIHNQLEKGKNKN